MPARTSGTDLEDFSACDLDTTLWWAQWEAYSGNKRKAFLMLEHLLSKEGIQ